jgi:hypothetical protein
MHTQAREIMAMLQERDLEFSQFKIECCGMHGTPSRVKLRMRPKSISLPRVRMYYVRMDFQQMTLLKNKEIKIITIACRKKLKGKRQQETKLQPIN